MCPCPRLWYHLHACTTPSGEKERMRKPTALTMEDTSSLHCCHKQPSQPSLLRNLAIFASEDYSWQSCLESMPLWPLKWELLLHLCQSRRRYCISTPTQSRAAISMLKSVDPWNQCSHTCPDPTPDLLPLHP